MPSTRHLYETHLIFYSGCSDEFEIPIKVYFTYYPGQPAYTPRGEYAPVDPPEPASVEVEKILVNPPSKDEESEWSLIPNWMDTLLTNDRGFNDELIEFAEYEDS